MGGDIKRREGACGTRIGGKKESGKTGFGA
jgi:hypothetical protein